MALTRKPLGGALDPASATRYLTDVQAQVAATSHALARRGEVTYVTAAGQVLIATRLRSGHIQLDSVCAC